MKTLKEKKKKAHLEPQEVNVMILFCKKVKAIRGSDAKLW